MVMPSIPAHLEFQLALFLAFFAAACGSGEDSTAPPKRPLSVLLVTLDTTRADALSCYGADGTGSGDFSAEPGATPCLDTLAAHGVRYKNASTVAPLTLPAHTSMLTGRIPPAHGIRENGLFKLSSSVQTVATIAHDAGARTAAFIGAVVLDSSYGLARGFELYDQPQRTSEQTSTHYVERPANQVVDAALSWLRKLKKDEQAFLWVHLFDAHQPYAPPAPFARSGASNEELYEGEVSFADSQLARIMQLLRASSRAKDTLVIVVADHGESLGEHGEWSHAAYCFEATLHVPLLIVYPNGYGAGTVSDETVSVVDVAPTVLEAMGLASDSAAAGFEDGLSLYGRNVPSDRRVYFESFSGFLSFGWAPIVGQRKGSFKVHVSKDARIFDLGSDPDESSDLSDREGARLDQARSWLASTLSTAALRATPPGSAQSAQHAADLGALGYSAASGGSTDLPDPLASGDLPSPYNRVQEYQQTLRASALENEGQPEEAQRLAERIVVQNAGNVVALETWTASLLKLQRFEEAVDGLERLVRLRPGTAGFRYNLGVALSRCGREDEGVQALWKAVELELDNESYLKELQQLLRSQGRRKEFEDYARRWQALRTAHDAQPSR